MNEEREGRRGRRGPEGRGEGRRRGGRMGRGGIRTAVLATLIEGPKHGYEIMQILEERTGGAWRPSAGSVYPMLQLLADEGLVTGTDVDGRRVYELTDAGRTEAEARLAAAGGEWRHPGADDRSGGLRDAARQMVAALRQVSSTGSEVQVAKAVEIVTKARKDLYQLLAED